MSKLDELIQEFCPNGVEYKTLGDIATDIYRGSGIKRDQIKEVGIPCVRYGEIYTTYGVWFDKCVSHTDEGIISNPKYFEYGDILFAITGESVEDIAKSWVKFAATVERLDKKTSVVDVIEVFMAFSKWLQYRMSFDPNVTPELLKTINHYHDLFISEKLKESF